MLRWCLMEDDSLKYIHRREKKPYQVDITSKRNCLQKRRTQTPLNLEGKEHALHLVPDECPKNQNIPNYLSSDQRGTTLSPLHWSHWFGKLRGTSLCEWLSHWLERSVLSRKILPDSNAPSITFFFLVPRAWSDHGFPRLKRTWEIKFAHQSPLNNAKATKHSDLTETLLYAKHAIEWFSTSTDATQQPSSKARRYFIMFSH